ncbi:MAG: YbaK/EbsC family protein [Alphaproteobacteria bacterium]|nr:YbaK/EbsC family protein [Alphaproteobacteria bacterium]
MNNALKKSAMTVQKALERKGIECCVIELEESARTAQDAALALKCDVAQIVKSLIFKTKDTHRPVLVLASGTNRVNEKIIASHIGEKITRADATFVRDITGFAIGGIPPLGHKETINHIFIDQDLLNFDSLWAAAGTPHAVFKLHAKETNGCVITIDTE